MFQILLSVKIKLSAKNKLSAKAAPTVKNKPSAKNTPQKKMKKKYLWRSGIFEKKIWFEIDATASFFTRSQFGDFRKSNAFNVELAAPEAPGSALPAWDLA